MVERSKPLDLIFASLGDPTRRDILRRVARKSMNVGEIAQAYAVSLASVAKHIDVLAHARLIKKTRRGKQQIVSINPAPLGSASRYLEQYHHLWQRRLDRLGQFLEDSGRGVR